MKGRLELGAVAGIKISIHWTFVLLLAWIVFGNVRSGLDASASLWSVLFVLSIFVCVVLHELGHALTARRFGISTHDITLYPIGGVARLDSLPKKPKQELLVALAGPAVNLVIAMILYPIVDTSGIEDAAKLAQVGPDNFVLLFVTVNIWLAVFNLIPAFPMDGGRVLRALLGFKMDRVKATKVAGRLGQIISIGFMITGFYANPFLMFIGLFIFAGAQSEINTAQTEMLLEGHSLLDLTMTSTPVIQMNSKVEEVVQMVLGSQNKNFIVLNDGQIVGTLDENAIIKALKEKDENCKVSEVMDSNLLYLSSQTPIEEALQTMQRESKSVAMVRKNGEVVGMINHDNLVEFIVFEAARRKI